MISFLQTHVEVLIAILDINECTTKSQSCHVDAVCQNTKGSYKCSCKAGYTGHSQKCTGNSFNTTYFDLLNYSILAG